MKRINQLTDPLKPSIEHYGQAKLMILAWTGCLYVHPHKTQMMSVDYVDQMLCFWVRRQQSTAEIRFMKMAFVFSLQNTCLALETAVSCGFTSANLPINDFWLFPLNSNKDSYIFQVIEKVAIGSNLFDDLDLKGYVNVIRTVVIWP